MTNQIPQLANHHSNILFTEPCIAFPLSAAQVQRLIEKTSGQRVADVMTENPLVVHPDTSIEQAARLLLEKKIRRLPVVDQEGKLVGVLSRGNIVAAALEARNRCVLMVAVLHRGGRTKRKCSGLGMDCGVGRGVPSTVSMCTCALDPGCI